MPLRRRVLVAASSESVFVRDCMDCEMTIACKQLRTRDCHNCTFYLYSKTEPIIELSDGIKFAPFNAAYPAHAEVTVRSCYCHTLCAGLLCNGRGDALVLLDTAHAEGQPGPL
jgi:hypothetical protein